LSWNVYIDVTLTVYFPGFSPVKVLILLLLCNVNSPLGAPGIEYSYINDPCALFSFIVTEFPFTETLGFGDGAGAHTGFGGGGGGGGGGCIPGFGPKKIPGGLYGIIGKIC
jgi:hypothetical protein